ncbi:FliI/YscN family ATPase [Thermomonas brevis]|uniref:protein-secreting ATPase n=1 Tax=Thermomonas brevis TaxID=215691 RepID=A0A7G9QSL1_9GAMM|nr:FliI/YscN family ATPase [Thermomonas brevis]QNN46336.1 FliI/YscN family ATPase [Thermomonas brevis]
MKLANRLIEKLGEAEMVQRLGRLEAFNGLVIESIGPDARLGELCELMPCDGREAIQAEVVGFRQGRVLLMPYGNVHGISPGSRIRATGRALRVPVGDALLGRVVDAFGRPLDAKGELHLSKHYPLHREPINPLERAAISDVLETGIRGVDGLLTMGVGQRMGVFAGSGVGKSTLLGMMARHVRADVTVLALVGERGREVGDFLSHALGEDGLRRSVVIAATADQPALVRTHAVHAAHAVAEYFRDQGKSVLLIVDSMTRFAMAQREIGLATGEPPTFRGYTPSVFAQLPRLLERCGRLARGGSISAIYSVLVEGDDMNEPVTDHMRAILDGHIVLTRELAARGHLPAIDMLQSTSRLMGQLASKDEQAVAREIKRLIATYESSRDLIELGAHQRGVNPLLDTAVDRKPLLDAVLSQAPGEATPRMETLGKLRRAMEATA